MHFQFKRSGSTDVLKGKSSSADVLKGTMRQFKRSSSADVLKGSAPRRMRRSSSDLSRRSSHHSLKSLSHTNSSTGSLGEDQSPVEMEARVPLQYHGGSLVWRAPSGARVVLSSASMKVDERILFSVPRSVMQPPPQGDQIVHLESMLPAEWDGRATIMTTMPSGHRLKIVPPTNAAPGSALAYSVHASNYEEAARDAAGEVKLFEVQADLRWHVVNAEPTCGKPAKGAKRVPRTQVARGMLALAMPQRQWFQEVSRLMSARGRSAPVYSSLLVQQASSRVLRC